MKSFKIYAELGSNPDTEHFKEFMKSVENRINNDPEIIARAKAGNVEFAKKLKDILANKENAELSAALLQGCRNDELDRKFYLHDVGKK